MIKTIVLAGVALPTILASFFSAHSGGFTVQQNYGTPTAAVSQASQGVTAVNVPIGTDTSENWAGYVATNNNTYTSVGASWSVPQSAAPAGTSIGNLSADATWVGIGGVTSHDLIQAGTQTIFQGGSPSYQAWYELLPATSVQVPLTIHPGDAMTVALTESSNSEWQISFNDNTTGQSYSTDVPYASSLSSAEWIEEMPSDTRGFVTLDNFGTASFTNAFTIDNGSRVTIAGAGAKEMTMIENGTQELAAPSSLGPDGASFTVTRTSTTVVPQQSSSTVTIRRTGRWSRTSTGVQGYVPPAQPAAQPQQATTYFRRFGNNLWIQFQSLRNVNVRIP